MPGVTVCTNPTTTTTVPPTTTTTVPPTTTTPAAPLEYNIGALDTGVAQQAVSTGFASSDAVANCGPADTSFDQGTDILCYVTSASLGAAGMQLEIIQITGEGMWPTDFNVLIGPGSDIPCQALDAAELAALNAYGGTCNSG
jgi:hypothetical protein